MKRLISNSWAALLALVGVAISAPAFGAGGPKFNVTVTNLTAHQTFTPVLAASAKDGVTIFKLGQAPSLALQDLAESGDTNMLKTADQRRGGAGSVRNDYDQDP